MLVSNKKRKRAQVAGDIPDLKFEFKEKRIKPNFTYGNWCRQNSNTPICSLTNLADLDWLCLNFNTSNLTYS